MEPPPAHMLAEMAEMARGGGYRWDGTYEWRSDAAGRRITTFTYNFQPSEGATFAAFSRQFEVVQGDVGIPDLEVALAAAAAAGPLNAAAIEQTAGVVGTKVGDGQCSDFGDAIATSTKAKPPTWDGPPSGTNARWGEEVSLEAVAPGDVLQFYSVQLRGTKGTMAYHEERGRPEDMHMHTAVVCGVAAPLVLSVLEQNIAGSPVILSTLDFNDLVSGEVHAYRLVPAGGGAAAGAAYFVFYGRCFATFSPNTGAF